MQRGFYVQPHLIFNESFYKDIGRNREISISSLGTPNEMIFLIAKNKNEVTDLICIHNYDYDGYLTAPKLDTILSIFLPTKK